ncbi:MAG: serine hydrolase, partial [Bacteroidota bacterium]
WTSKLSKEIMRLEAETEGEVGLYIKNLSDGREFVHNGDENWYFASTVKIPLAIAVLKEVEDGEISLDDELILQESDYVDGSGDLLGMPPGTRLSIRELIQQMVWHSDNSATDMLIRLIGEKEFNDFVQKYLDASGINYITTILQVRYDAYSEFHDYAANLKSTDIVFINSTPSRKERVMRLTGKMSVDPSDLRVASIEEAFEKYYLRELNSGKTESMGKMLEQLYYGELLSAEHTSFLLETMTNITTGDRRIKAGLPTGTQFAQKTGTQIRRAVNMGIIFPNDKKMEPIIVVACVRGINNPQKAEKIFKNIGILLSDTFLE